MSKKSLTPIILCMVATASMYAGYIIGEKHNPATYETMNSLLKSNRDMETFQNIKALEGLRDNKVEIVIAFMQARVKSELQQEGIEQHTIERAKRYQQKYCEGACLGIE